jgi:hypothetical protein
MFNDGTLEEFNEDCCFLIKDLSGDSLRSDDDAQFLCNLADIKKISEELDIPWEFLKDNIFAYINQYIDFL